ncbi:MAG: hypothetical protein R3E33_04845 [Rhodocyclaceae bacterium]
MARVAVLKALLPALLALTLTACENAAAPYMIDGAAHAITLVREQRWFWSSEVEQALVVSKMPKCQRRFAIRPGTTDTLKIEVYSAGDELWALHDRRYWYLASPEKCRVQEWTDPPAAPPGREVGAFMMRDGGVVFEPVQPAARVGEAKQ